MYGSVESLALYRYKSMGYPKGVHCEGAFPITLFGVLFWNEIYNGDIPGAFVSLYQDAPMDLFGSEFYENRKKQFDTKLQIIRKFDSEVLSKHLKNEFDLHCDIKSICQNNLFNNSDDLQVSSRTFNVTKRKVLTRYFRFQEIALCLGVEGVVGICERLIHNFVLWRAGFPDLIVWNASKKQVKFLPLYIQFKNVIV